MQKTKIHYYELLGELHEILKPQKYLEVGVRHGASLCLAAAETFCIGIDPKPDIKKELNEKTQIFEMTSDSFFEINKDNSELLKNIDMAFIDGMHLYEYVLRDFINTEKNSKKESVIILHDTIPKDKITSERKRTTTFWTGDVFKIIMILKKYRPDLKLYNLDAAPSGLAVITNLDPLSTFLEDNYDKIIEEFNNIGYEHVENNKQEILDIQSAEFNCVSKFFCL